MSAEITPVVGSLAWRVTCAEHALNRLVYTQQHATNIAQLHDRKDHAETPEQTGGETFHIAAAAQALLDARDARGGAFDVFIALTGCESESAALALAERYAASGFTAHTAPF